MKYLAIFLTIFLLYFVNLSLQIPQFNNCPDDIVQASQNGCGVYTCDGGDIRAVGCPEYRCAGPELGYEAEDYSKPYPACCGGPICE